MRLIIRSIAFWIVLSICPHTTFAAVYNILDYGAVNDTTSLSTMALQRAIDACSKGGGGTVLVPAGNYKTGSIFLKSNTTLSLENGAVIYGSCLLYTTPSPRDKRQSGMRW